MGKSLVIALTLIIAACDPATTDGLELAADVPFDEITELAPGSRVRVGDFEIAVPTRTGETVAAGFATAKGWTEVTIERLDIERARVELTSLPQSAATKDSIAAGAGECGDASFARTWQWPGTYRFRLRNAAPAGMSVGHVETAVLTAMADLTSGRNGCGLSTNLSHLRYQYLGRTSTGWPAYPGCYGRDGQSVVGFRSIGPRGWYCRYSAVRGDPAEADIAYSTREAWFTGHTVPAGCSSELHLESEAMHTFGHVFGLLHPPGWHPTLTMDGVPVSACNVSKATLGLGDIRGLANLAVSLGDNEK